MPDGARTFQSSTVGASGSSAPSASHLTMLRWLFHAPCSAYTFRPPSSKMWPATCAISRPLGKHACNACVDLDASLTGHSLDLTHFYTSRGQEGSASVAETARPRPDCPEPGGTAHFPAPASL